MISLSSWQFLFICCVARCTAFGTIGSAKIHPEIETKLDDSSTIAQVGPGDRRAFLSGAAALTSIPLLGVLPAYALDIKVTPLAHTFITSSGAPKPLRENDATRFLTNARVVYLFSGEKSGDTLPTEVLKLTAKRKADQGPGVTPGGLHVATSNKVLQDTATSLGLSTPTSKGSIGEIATIAASLPAGDALIVGPITTAGVAADGKLVADCAKALGVDVGGAKSGGVLSVTLDGPQQNVVMEAGGYPVSTILWYSIP